MTYEWSDLKLTNIYFTFTFTVHIAQCESLSLSHQIIVLSCIVISLSCIVVHCYRYISIVESLVWAEFQGVWRKTCPWAIPPANEEFAESSASAFQCEERLWKWAERIEEGSVRRFGSIWSDSDSDLSLSFFHYRHSLFENIHNTYMLTLTLTRWLTTTHGIMLPCSELPSDNDRQMKQKKNKSNVQPGMQKRNEKKRSQGQGKELHGYSYSC